MKDTLLCRVLILPNRGDFYPLFKTNKMGHIGYSNRQYPDKETSQHLYLVSDREIKEGDYYWNSISGSIHKNLCSDSSNWDKLFKKVEATTNISANLPLVPKSFVEEYVGRQGKIDTLKLEYIPTTGAESIIPPHTLARNELNEVIILPIKDSWNREELRDAMKRAAQRYGSSELQDQFVQSEFNKWFDKNY